MVRFQQLSKKYIWVVDKISLPQRDRKLTEYNVIYRTVPSQIYSKLLCYVVVLAKTLTITYTCQQDSIVFIAEVIHERNHRRWFVDNVQEFPCSVWAGVNSMVAIQAVIPSTYRLHNSNTILDRNIKNCYIFSQNQYCSKNLLKKLIFSRKYYLLSFRIFNMQLRCQI